MDDILAALEALEESYSWDRWSQKRVALIAEKYSHYADFREHEPNACAYVERKGLFTAVCGHMAKGVHRRKKWTPERVAEEALKFNDIRSFRKRAAAAYSAALKMGIVREICGHMLRGKGGFDLSAPGKVYVARLETRTTTVYKVGITNGDPRARLKNTLPIAGEFEIIHVYRFQQGHQAAKCEKLIHGKFAEHRYCGPEKLLHNGNTELFTINPLPALMDLTGIHSKK